jgi:RNA polymerase sigma-70 factor (ECF subfamily)
MFDDGRRTYLDDAGLLRLAHRDPAAFRVLYDRHVVRVHQFMLRRTGDAAAAFELTAETFARAWVSRDRFNDQGGGALPWLFGIARNVLAAAVRDRAIPRNGRQRVGLDAAHDVAEPRQAWLAGIDDDLAAALADLPEALRRAVELRVLERASFGEVGEELGSARGAARVRVHRGLAALRMALRLSRPVPVHTKPNANQGDVP